LWSNYADSMCKLSFSLLILLALHSTVPAQTEPPGWITLAPEGAGFSMLFAGKPVETVDKKTSFTLHSFNVTVGRATYIASYSDYLPGKLDPATALTANRDKFNKSLEGTLTTGHLVPQPS